MKALDYWKKIDKEWWNGNTEPMNTFIENSNIFFGRDGGDLYEAIHNRILSELNKMYSDKELEKLLNLPIPSDLKLDENGNLIYKKDGTYDSLYWDYVDYERNDLLCEIQIAKDIGGNSALKELQQQYNIDEKIWDFFFDSNFKGYMEDILYGGIQMSDLLELINKLNITTSVDDKPYVFWTENMMYIDDNSGHNFTLQTDLYHAWKFAHIFDLDLDYDASDDEVLKLGKLIVNEYNDCDDFYLVDIDEYFNDIQKDFNEFLGLKWSNTDWQQVKRNIIQQMENNIDEIGIGGSATFIAKWLYDTINDRIVFNRFEYPTKNKSLLLDLRCAYLSTDNYDIQGFAKALHKNCQKEVYIPIDDNGGYLWINNCKYENVVHILINEEEVQIYDENNCIGSILRENINTFLVGHYYNYGNDYDVNDLLDFHIQIAGDF